MKTNDFPRAIIAVSKWAEEWEVIEIKKIKRWLKGLYAKCECDIITSKMFRDLIKMLPYSWKLSGFAVTPLDSEKIIVELYLVPRK